MYLIESRVLSPCPSFMFMPNFFVSVRDNLDIAEGGWGHFETTKIDVAEFQANAHARVTHGERSREVLRDLIIDAFAGEDVDNRLLELPPVDLEGVVAKCGRSVVQPQ